ncbi:MAG TPA: MliC family protein [Candidatus Paceibacterota bacterium]|nr:MliC family protein [Candidatus Paceibacterota bacterium]
MENTTHTKTIWAWLIIAILVVLAYVSFHMIKRGGDIDVPPGFVGPKNDIVNDVVFACTAGKSIHAVFHTTNTVDLVLSDGRALSIPQVISASGARYADADESFVFWNKGNTAFIQEKGATTFAGCAIK